MSEDGVRQALANAHRDEWARVLASTVRVARDLDVAEESVQEAFTDALVAWSREGVPTKPVAWLTTVARRRAIDALRRASTHRTKLPLLVEPLGEDDDVDPATVVDGKAHAVADDALRLIFMCCHPALSREAQTALTLRLVCGMSTPDVARCFLVPEPTMAARLTRAKKKITLGRIPFQVPSVEELSSRLDGVLGVVYLLITVGHTSPSGDVLVRSDTAEEAVRLARLLHAMLPEEREVGGLLALGLVIVARQDSRVIEGGIAQRISEQDRSTWDRSALDEAQRLIVSSLQRGRAGRYTLQAAIASLHAEAPSYDEVDWPQIVELYDELLRVWPTPVVELNRAVALSKTSGPAPALRIVERLEDDARLEHYQYLPATKAHLLDELGRHDEAATAREAARTLILNDVERASLDAHER